MSGSNPVTARVPVAWSSRLRLGTSVPPLGGASGEPPSAWSAWTRAFPSSDNGALKLRTRSAQILKEVA
jgi:hypothetical protein